MVTHSLRFLADREYISNEPKSIKPDKIKYCCEVCGSTFEPGDKKEGVEIHPQSWPCPMCGYCDWKAISAVREERTECQE
jgi:methionyl-tRNA synthetase